MTAPAALPAWGPLVAAGLVVFGVSFTAAKNYLDKNNIDYKSMFETVIIVNRKHARQRLEWIADDFTSDTSAMSLTHLNDESYVHDQTMLLVVCFKRMRRCRRAMKRVTFAFEVVKWSALAGIAATVVYALSNVLTFPFVVERVLSVVSIANCVITLAGLFCSEVWLQKIRKYHDESKELDATAIA